MKTVTPDPFFLEGNEVGILMIHGFTGSPAELRPVAEEFHAQGWTVYAPLLPGHGTTPAEMNTMRYTDWQQAVNEALDRLKQQCTTVVVAGQSMGGVLALDLAERRGAELSGVIAYAPALISLDRLAFLVPVARYFLKFSPKGPHDFVDTSALDRLWDYDVNPVLAAHELFTLTRQVRRKLQRITSPILVMHSQKDKIIDPRSSQIVYDQVASAQKELAFVDQCGHVLTLDVQWREVAQRSVEFVRRYAISA